MNDNPWYIVSATRSLQDRFIVQELFQAEFEPYNPLLWDYDINRNIQLPVAKSKPMIPGYVFVRNVRGKFVKLEQVSGVRGILRLDGNPIELPEVDYQTIRNLEIERYDTFSRDWHSVINKRSRKERREAAKSLKNKWVRIGQIGSLFDGREGHVESVSSDDAISLIVEGLGRITLNADQVRVA